MDDVLTDDCARHLLQLATCSTRLALAAVSSRWHALVWMQETLWLNVTVRSDGFPDPKLGRLGFDRLADVLVHHAQLSDESLQAGETNLLRFVDTALQEGPASHAAFLGISGTGDALDSYAHLCSSLFQHDARVAPGVRTICSQGALPPDMYDELRHTVRATSLALYNWSLPNDGPTQRGRLKLEGLVELVIDRPSDDVDSDDWPDLLTRVLAHLPAGLRRLVCELPLDEEGSCVIMPDTDSVREAWVRVAPTLEHLVLHGDSFFTPSFAVFAPAMQKGWGALRELQVPGSDGSAALALIHSACGGSLEAFSDAMPCLQSLGGLTVHGRSAVEYDRLMLMSLIRFHSSDIKLQVPSFLAGSDRQRAYLKDENHLAAIGLRGLNLNAASASTRPVLPRLRVLFVYCSLSGGCEALADFCNAWRLHLPQVRHVFIQYYQEELSPLVDVAR
eukprot:6614835-Prymnesium_polylepis.1